MYFHIPVLLDEIIEIVDSKPGENLVDRTISGGSYAKAILKRTSPGGKLLGIDLDDEALVESKQNLQI
ncbi:MAG: 16S rRNA (cytosine(1402)-N(4))-methyltransferase [Patescibacteria group bacterium]|nr:16S rRNA (cytosine(1402)-N(4))-methyltransferase [Patescibacteria group bacterium]